MEISAGTWRFRRYISSSSSWSMRANAASLERYSSLMYTSLEEHCMVFGCCNPFPRKRTSWASSHQQASTSSSKRYECPRSTKFLWLFLLFFYLTTNKTSICLLAFVINSCIQACFQRLSDQLNDSFNIDDRILKGPEMEVIIGATRYPTPHDSINRHIRELHVNI